MPWVYFLIGIVEHSLPLYIYLCHGFIFLLDLCSRPFIPMEDIWKDFMALKCSSRVQISG